MGRAAALELGPAVIDGLLNRHHCGDCGDLGEDDKWANDLDLKEGGRLLSRYDIEAGSFYVITEWGRGQRSGQGSGNDYQFLLTSRKSLHPRQDLRREFLIGSRREFPHLG